MAIGVRLLLALAVLSASALFPTLQFAQDGGASSGLGGNGRGRGGPNAEDGSGGPAMAFSPSLVSPAVGIIQDLYEPTVTVSPTGTIYVAGHVVGTLTTGTPAYYSTNDGVSWAPLPIAGQAALPVGIPGAAPPNGNEGTIVADETGRAWMFDMSGHNAYVQGWCYDGAVQCFYQPDAWNNADAAVTSCGVASLATDRPWVSYADDKLLLVNNGFAGTAGRRMQVGVLDVQPGLPVAAVPPEWNGCASNAGFIPGVPSLRADGAFVVPQIQSGSMAIVTGDASDLFALTTTPVFSVAAELLPCFDAYGGGNVGVSTLSSEGTFFLVGATGSAEIGLAASSDGLTFSTSSFATGGPVSQLWISGSQLGEGALMTWAQDRGSCTAADFYAAHVTLSDQGVPTVSDVSLVAADQPFPCGDLMGSSLGPDGRAYVAVYASRVGCQDFPLDLPITVWIQDTGGATL